VKPIKAIYLIIVGLTPARNLILKSNLTKLKV